MHTTSQLLAAAAIAVSASASMAADFNFNTAPFDGVDVSAPGRQVVGNELFIDTFNPGTDRFVFDAAAFGVGALSFFNGSAAALGASGYNVIALRDTDNDANPATPFAAGSAANLIAARIDTAGAGFFVYTNSALGLNRLVFSSDLSDPTADLKIVARLLQPTGAAAAEAMQGFNAQNFALAAAVPEPQTYALLLAGLGAVGFIARRRRAAQAV